MAWDSVFKALSY